MDEYEFNQEDAKTAINNILWMYAPPTMTLKEAEDIAVRFLVELVHAWAKFKNN